MKYLIPLSLALVSTPAQAQDITPELVKAFTAHCPVAEKMTSSGMVEYFTAIHSDTNKAIVNLAICMAWFEGRAYEVRRK